MSTSKIEGFIQDSGLTFEYLPAFENPNSDGFKDANHWTCKITALGKSMILPYSKGPAHRRYKKTRKEATYQARPTQAFMDETEPTPPSLAETLECLACDSSAAEESFNDFADQMDLDRDSRQAYATWEVCQRQTVKLVDLIGRDQLKRLQSIEF